MDRIPIAMTDWRDRNPLRAWRLKNDISAYEVAARLGVSVQAVSRWESGAASPGAESMTKIAALVGRADVAEVWAAWQAEVRM